jgi:hypothetical protein
MTDAATDLKTPVTGADPAPTTADTSKAETTTTTETTASDPTKSAPKGDFIFDDGDDTDTPAAKDAPADKSDTDKTKDSALPENWREIMADGDEKLLARLKRFSHPSKVTKSWLSAEQKISSGEFKKGLPENPTPEQLAEWRTQQGIPEAPDKYVPPAIEGFEWGDADKPLLDAFFTDMHAANAPQAQVDAALKAYSKIVADAQVQRVEADKAFRVENEDRLRADLGAEFRPQMTLVKRALEDADGPIPPAISQKLLSARDGDGNRIINDATTMKWLSELALNHYGPGAMISGDAKVSMTSRIDELRNLMKTDFRKYIETGGDKEYGKLLAQQSGKRSAAPAYDDD